MRWNEMIGNTFGDMYVLRRATMEETPWRSHEVPLWVKCTQCGKEWVARKGDIEKNKSCPHCHKLGGRGHFDKEMIGKQYGYLTVIGYDQEATLTHGGPRSRKSYWLCQCRCGNVISVRKEHLEGKRHSCTISCGCATRSAGEINTQNALDNLQLNYNIETIIPECHKWSPFDIEVINPKTGKRLCFFECDGEQHYKIIAHFGMDEEDLIHQQEIDNIKNSWCKEHNIPLFRIPYTEYGNITPEWLQNRFPEFKKLLESI